jgi:primosomal protein N' (replication factor Y)
MIVEVALPVPVFKTFDYSIPADMIPVETHTLVGRRVRVPFGPRKPIGFIVGLKEQSSFPNTKFH